MYIEKKFNVIQELSASGKLTGILLISATFLSILAANTIPAYTDFFHSKINLGILNLSIEHWINDGLMAVFFFMVGLEIKREVIVGELADFKNSSLSVVAAIGGVIFPALIFVMFNSGTANINGWAIPTATDIAFSLGILTLIGGKEMRSLKIFLTALAIIDDLIAVLIIALFYSGSLQYTYLLIGLIIVVIYYFMNKKKQLHPAVYVLQALVLWYLIFNSGVHATIAGVLFAMTIPVNLTDDIEHFLHKWVNYLILPVFAIANTAIIINAESIAGLTTGLGLGVTLGLLLGKPLGISLASYFAIKTGISKAPQNVNLQKFIGVGFLAGVGFTMSIFISKLSFNDNLLVEESILAVILGSLLSAIIGYFILKKSKD